MSSKIMAIKESIEKTLRDDSKPWTRYLALAEKKLQVDRLYLFVGGVVFMALYLVFGIGQQLISNILGFAYPAFCSMKAIESKQKDDDTKWLTYWVVFATFTILEYFSDCIVGWFPIYWLAKCLFYLWLMMPTEYNGSLILYRRLIRPKFIQYSSSVDNLLDNVKKTAIQTADDLLSHKSD